jgi:hypothetical protein
MYGESLNMLDASTSDPKPAEAKRIFEILAYAEPKPKIQSHSRAFRRRKGNERRVAYSTATQEPPKLLRKY